MLKKASRKKKYRLGMFFTLGFEKVFLNRLELFFRYRFMEQFCAKGYPYENLRSENRQLKVYMSILKPWDAFGIDTGESESRRNQEQYFKDLRKKREAERKKHDEEFSAKWREEQREEFSKSVYGIEKPAENNEGYRTGNIPMSGKSSGGPAQSSNSTASASLGRGMGNRGDKGGFQKRNNYSNSSMGRRGGIGGGGGLKRF